MSRRCFLCGCPALAGLAIMAGLADWMFSKTRSGAPEAALLEAGPPRKGIPRPGEPPAPASASPAELRKHYPIVSVSPRLEFEARRRGLADRPQPMLGDESRKRLSALEQQYGGKKGSGAVRAQSLSLLHSNEVDKFMKREGFGLSRMPDFHPSPQHLEYPEPPALALAPLSADDDAWPPVATIALPESGVLEEPGGAWTPSRALLNDFHSLDQQMFASPWSLGWVKDRDHVAGFVPHGFGHLPELMHPQNRVLPPDPASGKVERESHPARWIVGRLELISLLKSEEPAAYVSESLPRMKALAHAPTRPLTEFERQALAALEDGEDLVTAPTTNDIYMVGAVRAVQQCTACHDARRGELLGAFSYRLKRSPPSKVVAPTTKPAA